MKTFPSWIHCLFLLLLAAALYCRPAAAQSENYWPQDDLTIVVYAPAGSDADYVSRLLAGRLMRIYGRSVTVENQPDKSGPDGTRGFADDGQPQNTIYVLQTDADPRKLLKQENPQVAAGDDSVSSFDDSGYVPLDAVISLPQFLVVLPGKDHDVPIDIQHLTPQSGNGSLTLGLGRDSVSDSFKQLLARRIPGSPGIQTFDTPAGALDALLDRKIDLALARPSVLIPLLETRRLAFVGATSGTGYAKISPDSAQPLDLAAADHELKIMFLISDKLPENLYNQINTTIRRFFSEAVIRQKLESQFMILPVPASGQTDKQKSTE